LPEGRLIRAAEMETRQQARSVVLVQDTSAGLQSTLLAASRDADVVIHEATYHHELAETSIERGHSTAHMAGLFAQRARAKMLVLTHFSLRYSDKRTTSSAIQTQDDAENPPTTPNAGLVGDDIPLRLDIKQLSVQDLVTEAKAACPECEVVAACDFMVIDSSPRGDSFTVAQPLDLKADAQPQILWPIDDG